MTSEKEKKTKDKMKNQILLAVALEMGLAATACASDLICLGDSVTAALRVGTEDAFCTRLGGQVVAKYGAFAHGGLRLLPDALKNELTKKPKVATVMYGMNDCYIDEGKTQQRVSTAEYYNNMKRLIRLLKKNRIKPVLMTPNSIGDQTNPLPNRNVNLKNCVNAVRKLAKQEKVPLVDIYQLYSELFQEGIDPLVLTYDGVHPTAYGQKLIADAARPVVRRELRK